MKQLTLFPDEQKVDLNFWTPFPGLIGVYYQSEENKVKQRKSIDQWRQEKPHEAARLDDVISKLKTKIETIVEKHKR